MHAKHVFIDLITSSVSLWKEQPPSSIQGYYLHLTFCGQNILRTQVGPSLQAAILLNSLHVNCVQKSGTLLILNCWTNFNYQHLPTSGCTWGSAIRIKFLHIFHQMSSVLELLSCNTHLHLLYQS